MEYFSCLWKKISRIVIVVIALFCVGSIMPEEVKAYEGVDLRYKEEGTIYMIQKAIHIMDI